MEVRPGYKQTQVGVIPEEWDVATLGDCIETPPSYGINSPAVPYSDRLPAYVRITDITEDGRLSLDQRVSVLSEMSESYYLADGDIVFARTGASVGKSYRYNPDDGPLVYAGFLIRVRPNRQKLLPAFAAAYATTGAYWNWVRLMSMRSGQPGINGNEYTHLPIPLPPLPEQGAIAAALGDVDALLGGLDRLIAKKRDLKQATMQQLLTGQTRLPGFHGEWEVKRFADLLKYERPDKFFVKIVEYEEKGDTPVLTANKSFVLGYTNERFGIYDNLPVIIFDDFTTDSKYVDFPFKVKSSAIKILKAKTGEVNLKFVSERMRLLTFPLGEHKRYYISEYQHIGLPTPRTDEQDAIAAVLSDMDAELAALEARRDKTRALKQGMMQELLTGKTRLVAPPSAVAAVDVPGNPKPSRSPQRAST
jgi:type I restriction enzyme S subunit